MSKRITNTLPWYHPASLICQWFGAGRSPKAPGTVGSLAAIPFAYALLQIYCWQALLVAGVVLFFIGWAACEYYLKFSQEKDPKEVVVDEVAGLWILLTVMPETWQAWGLAFLLFRFFDVLKPWPVSVVDRTMKTPLGVMLDDILAGFYPVFLLLVAFSIAHFTNTQQAVEHFLVWLGTGHGF